MCCFLVVGICWGVSLHFLFQKSICKTGSSISEGVLPGVCSKILSSFKTSQISFDTTDLLDWLYVNLKCQTMLYWHIFLFGHRSLLLCISSHKMTRTRKSLSTVCLGVLCLVTLCFRSFSSLCTLLHLPLNAKPSVEAVSK